MKSDPISPFLFDSIPSLDFSSSGQPLLFLHANGYPPECYRPLLEGLAKKYHVRAMLQRPLWSGSDPDELTDWGLLTDDLLHFMASNYSTPVIGIGHSMGGIALLRAALNKPDLFCCIILLDPVLFPPYFIRFWRVVRSLGLDYRLHPLAAAARNRRSQFSDLDRLLQGYRRKPVFKYLNDEALGAYIRGIACQSPNGGYELCYPVAWEIQIYLTGIWRDLDLWQKLPSLSVPMLIIRGALSDTFWATTGHLVRQKNKSVRVEELQNATHLVPLERPAEAQELIYSILENNQ
jgi:pimeloyl-ACP methyl ester carboxylesterase